MKKLIILMLTALLLYSCKARKTVDGGNEAATTEENPRDMSKRVPADLTFYQHVLQNPEFDQLKISSKISMESATTYLPTLDATIYIQNNEKVWMNLSAFFINVARGIATPDGVKAYNRNDKTYIDSDFEYLNNLLNTNFLNYHTLQRLLIGRTFVKINSREFMLTKNSKGYTMASTVNQSVETEEGEVREYQVEIRYASNFDLNSVHLTDVDSGDELQVIYNDWEEFRNYRLPKNVKLIIKGAKSSQILLENTKFDDSKMQTPFSVPGNYKKIEI
ncbi:DUF4292 domain-containing protein [Chryseobacterium sp. MFBS3-17]|uniref:DUF4292 domain-containing protein n=1 Tax=Chryseobacterium sp. MFBS3-17 TaxID=2886689 RepID=UPI001D0E4DBD|nr:DUF4292 domain-containing protein [Chryseobacterium sp. MFBS3-17]MCC2589575.1 DUF4292 domain-containing protein [Chryseobacterium sp. MFBS3-17]